MSAFWAAVVRFLPITGFDRSAVSRDLAPQDFGVEFLGNRLVVRAEAAESVLEGIACWPREGVYNVNILTLIEGVLIAAVRVAQRLVEQIESFLIVED
jgi:hypothetical protein